MFERELAVIGERISQALAGLGAPAPSEVKWQPTPFAGEWGQGTNICFQAAAAEARSGKKVNVPARAQELARLVAEQVTLPPGFSRLVADKAYVNAYFDTASFAGRVVAAAITEGAAFGRGAPKSERVMVEYAQPNTHHSFHIGHARNALLGEALARIMEFAGFETIRASYPGDLGLTVITAVWGYKRFHYGQEPEGVFERGEWLLKIYAEATALLTEQPNETPSETEQRLSYEAERREFYRRYDAGDPEVRALWRMTRQWSLDEFQAILDMLAIHIDVFFFESEVDEPSKAIVDELIARGIAEDLRPDGPVVVKIDEKLGLAKEKYRTVVILRSDGTTLYSTKDLMLAKVKFEKYSVDRSLYVVDFRQSLYFQQVFKILELWGFPQAAKCYHLSYGYVTLPGGAMSSRKGHVVLFREVADEAYRRVQAVIAERNPDLDEAQRHTVSTQIGLGAIAYALLEVDNIRDIVFEWEAALSFDGRSAPYIQNAYVRANSILKKAQAAGLAPAEGTGNFPFALEPAEVELIDLLARFPGVVQQAALDYKPLHVANYVYELAKTFHGFYHLVPVLQTEDAVRRAARLQLVAATRQVLANALRLLAIQAPDVM
ncbi:MAG: arginine--tRNA ligase [Anaerolineales bacterium]|nr:arginine--tRNA ligase [Anaerolineales bacterium]